MCLLHFFTNNLNNVFYLKEDKRSSLVFEEKINDPHYLLKSFEISFIIKRCPTCIFIKEDLSVFDAFLHYKRRSSLPCSFSSFHCSIKKHI